MNPTLNSPFVYFACQHGAERTLKDQLCEPNGPYRLAYSHKGLITLKSQLATPPWSKSLPEHPLIRSRGHVLKRYEGETAEPMLEQILDEHSALDWEHLHIWQRDIAQPGWHGFEPGRSALAAFVCEKINVLLAARQDERNASTDRIAQSGTKLLELIIDEPNRWWIAAKPVVAHADGWPGGVFVPPEPEEMISRAYLKLAEAIRWSQMPIRAGDRVVEIGSSPGGACQLLLDLGAKVTGVDPADMDERVANHPSFTHWRSRSIQIKRKEFAPFKYLICDANVAPNYTLDTIEPIVTHPTSRIKGIILTMKLSDWEHSVHIPQHLERVKSWGFDSVQARQLAHNRREYCLAAKRG